MKTGRIVALRGLMQTFPLFATDSPFDYDHHADLEVIIHHQETKNGVQIADLTFTSDPSEARSRTRAYLVTPLKSSSPSPGILWGHWLGEPATTNRTQYLNEAIVWAQRGVTSLLPEAMWAEPDWYKNRKLSDDFFQGKRQVIAFRRAMDLLLSQPDIDPARTAFVAHDYSAMYGSIALAEDARITHAVFIAAAPSLEDWAFYLTKPDDMTAYLRQNRPLHLPTHLARLTGRTVLLQYAEKDFYVPPERVALFVESLAANKTVITYPEAGHVMDAPAKIKADRTAWLTPALGLKHLARGD